MSSTKRRTQRGIHRYSYNRFIRKAFIITVARTVQPREEKKIETDIERWKERGQKIEEQTRRARERETHREREGWRERGREKGVRVNDNRRSRDPILAGNTVIAGRA